MSLHTRLCSLSILIAGPVLTANASNAARPHVDRYGDALPENALGRLGSIRFRHGDKITGLAVSPDGRLVASAGLDRCVHVWDVKSGKNLHTFRGTANYPAALAFSEDGRLLGANLEGENILIWDLDKSGPPVTIKSGFVEELIFSSDAKALVFVDREAVRIHDRSSNKVRFEVSGAGSACVMRKAQIIVGGANGELTLRDLETGSVARELRGGHDRQVTSIAASYDGRLLTSSDGKTTCVWDLQSGKVLRTISAGGKVSFLPDREVLLIAHEGKLTAFDAKGESSNLVPLDVTRFALSRDGRLLVASGDSNVVHVWDLAAGKETTPVEGPDMPVLSLAFLKKNVLLAGDDKRLTVWDIEQKRARTLTQWPVRGLGTSRAAEKVAIGSRGHVHVWNSTDSLTDKSASAPGASVKVASENPAALALAPDGGRLLVCDGKDRLALVHAATGKVDRHVLAGCTANAIAFSPNGRLAAVLGRDGILRTWAIDPRTGADGRDTEVWRKRVQRAPVGAVVFSPDGFLIAASSRGRALIVEALSGRQLFSFEREFGEGDVLALGFSPDGRVLATGMGGHSGVVRLWETWTGKALARFDGHAGPVNAVAFSPDGRVLASGGGDTSILLWDVNAAGDISALQPLDLAQAWEQLDSQDIRQAYRAVNGLIAAGPKGVATVRDGLKSAEVGQEQIRKWIVELDDYQFRVRENAKRQLLAQGLRAVPALRAEQTKRLSLESEARLKLIFEDLAIRGVHAPEGGLFGEPLRTVRAVHVLERLGGKEALTVLEVLAKGPAEARATLEARAALARLRP